MEYNFTPVYLILFLRTFVHMFTYSIHEVGQCPTRLACYSSKWRNSSFNGCRILFSHKKDSLCIFVKQWSGEYSKPIYVSCTSESVWYSNAVLNWMERRTRQKRWTITFGVGKKNEWHTNWNGIAIWCLAWLYWRSSWSVGHSILFYEKQVNI